MYLPSRHQLLLVCLSSILALALLACGEGTSEPAGPVPDWRDGVADGFRRDLRHGGQSSQANGPGRDQRRGRD